MTFASNSRDAGLAVIEIRIGSEGLPWRLTFEFLADVYSVLRQTWLSDVARIEEFTFVLTGLEEGSKRFKGQLQPRRRDGKSRGAPAKVFVSQEVEFSVFETAPPQHRRISPGEALTAGAIVLGAILQPLVGGFVAKSPNAQLPPVAAPSIHPERQERMERYVRLHALDVTIEVTGPNGSVVLVGIGEVDVELAQRPDGNLELISGGGLPEDHDDPR
jgi:hypothetical protein